MTMNISKTDWTEVLITIWNKYQRTYCSCNEWSIGVRVRYCDGACTGSKFEILVPKLTEKNVECSSYLESKHLTSQRILIVNIG